MKRHAEELFKSLDVPLYPYPLSEEESEIERRREWLDPILKQYLQRASGLIVLASHSYGRDKKFIKSTIAYAGRLGAKSLLLLRLAIEDLYADYTLIDPSILTKRGARLINYFKQFEKPPTIRITSHSGTALSFQIDPRRVWKIDNGIPSLEQFAQLPAGEIYTCPIEETISGVIHVRWKGKNYWAKLTKGQVVAWSENLERRFCHDELRWMGEWGLGINPAIEVLTQRGAVDEKKDGTTHFGFGDNYGLGKKPRVYRHFDFLELNRPVIEVNEHVILRDRKWHIL
jgi:hypothetical protein